MAGFQGNVFAVKKRFLKLLQHILEEDNISFYLQSLKILKHL